MFKISYVLTYTLIEGNRPKIERVLYVSETDAINAARRYFALNYRNVIVERIITEEMRGWGRNEKVGDMFAIGQQVRHKLIMGVGRVIDLNVGPERFMHLVGFRLDNGQYLEKRCFEHNLSRIG